MLPCNCLEVLLESSPGNMFPELQLFSASRERQTLSTGCDSGKPSDENNSHECVIDQWEHLSGFRVKNKQISRSSPSFSK